MHFACYPIVTNCFTAADEIIQTVVQGFGDIISDHRNDLINSLKYIKK